MDWKKSIFFKLMYKFNAIPTKILRKNFFKFRKDYSKTYVEKQRSWNKFEKKG